MTFDLYDKLSLKPVLQIVYVATNLSLSAQSKELHSQKVKSLELLAIDLSWQKSHLWPLT